MINNTVTKQSIYITNTSNWLQNFQIIILVFSFSYIIFTISIQCYQSINFINHSFKQMSMCLSNHSILKLTFCSVTFEVYFSPDTELYSQKIYISWGWLNTCKILDLTVIGEVTWTRVTRTWTFNMTLFRSTHINRARSFCSPTESR